MIDGPTGFRELRSAPHEEHFTPLRQRFAPRCFHFVVFPSLMPTNRIYSNIMTKLNSAPVIVAGLTLSALLVSSQTSHAQGCVATRGSGGGMLPHGEDVYLQPNSWEAKLGYRWLYSDRHFIGRVENKKRQALGTDVRNDSHFIDTTIAYGISKRTSVSLTLPFVSSQRSSLYEHGAVDAAGNPERHEMSASGLADVRLTTTTWLFDPEAHHSGNIALGIGVKAPTGDSEAKDIKYKNKNEDKKIPSVIGDNYSALDFVDQSIQPGDGGWGFIVEAQGFQKLFDNAAAYMQMSYLISPEEMNGAYSYYPRGSQVKRFHSVPDSYLLRAGLSYSVWPSKGLSLSLGARMEGVPVEDLIGGSLGFRRPGYAVSIEPGVNWAYKKLSFNLTVPIAVERNRQRSYIEEVGHGGDGRGGDAAFADYIITSSVSYRF